MHDASGACVCGCADRRGAAAHAINAALRVDDIDGAIEAGLLDRATECVSCDDACRARLHQARDERIAALAARERHRARNARLERRARERERAGKRAPAPSSDVATPTPSALPSAAAAALARAREKAAQRHKP